MTAQYRPVSWNAAKRRYDAVLLASVAAWIALYLGLGSLLHDPKAPHDMLSLWIRALGSCAFVLLTLILAIGPLARLNRSFLPLLYNRRHLGVVTCVVALAHGASVLAWHFQHDDQPFLPWLLGLDITLGQARGVPFAPLGMAALAIMILLAATSHDFWLSFLRPPVWKALHMAVYAAYALAVGHFAFGAVQTATDPLVPLGLLVSCAVVVGLHIAAARHDVGRDSPAGGGADGWYPAGPYADIPDGRARIVRPPHGERVAIFRNGGTLSAVTNVCSHQNGPLGEGCIIDGLITCPWHGFQFRPEDGRAPEPFTDRIATYRLRLDGAIVLLDPRPLPPGTRVEPLVLPAA
jgi:nitrite reductase/ring-hydroxylating ferredoxin subunit/DMSO/TMAO reductase YedYZ heme-binding membrane subunit